MASSEGTILVRRATIRALNEGVQITLKNLFQEYCILSNWN